MVVHKIKSTAEYNEVISQRPRVLVDCFATWCGPCRIISPVLDGFSDLDHIKDKVYFIKIDVDELPEVAEQLQIRAMPTFVVYENGHRVGELIGADKGKLELMIVNLAAKADDVTQHAVSGTPQVNDVAQPAAPEKTPVSDM